MSENDTGGFAEKILKVLDGTADQQDFVALDRRIAEDPQVAQYYIDVLLIHLALSRSAGFQTTHSGASTAGPAVIDLMGNIIASDRSITQPNAGLQDDPERSPAGDVASLHSDSPSVEQDKVERIRRYAQQQLDAFLQEQHQCDRTFEQSHPGSWDFVGASRLAMRRLGAITRAGAQTAKVLAVWSLAIGLLTAVAGYFYSHRVVATVVDSVHTKWAGDRSGPELAPGWQRLEEGFARIAFKKGAEVLLQAPCEITLHSSNRMSMTSGRMTARVPKEAAGFSVRTPASRVVDYGTEFGLLIGTKGESEVHVFAGEVGLSQPGNARETRAQRLSTGHTAQVDRSGAVRLDTTANRPGMFLQGLPAEDGFGIPGKRLDLADLVSGGNGFGTGRTDSMICTGSGRFTTGAGNVWLDADARGVYVPVHALPYVDGVFIPDGSEGPVIVSSAGHRFNMGPDTDGMMPNGFVSANVYRWGRPFRVDLSQSGEVEPGWTDWNTGVRLENARLTRTFQSDFDPEFTVVFDSIDSRNRGQVNAAVAMHDLLDDDFKESGLVTMRLQGLDPGSYMITTYHHDPLEDSKDSDGTINIHVIDAHGDRLVAERFWQSWGPNPKVVASATFSFESDGREVVILFRDNDDATHNEAHINGFELDALGIRDSAGPTAAATPRPDLDGRPFGTRAHPAIYMHANIGITFDLESLRETLAGARIVAFQAKCGMMAGGAGFAERRSRAGFWVLVDGDVRFRSIEEDAATATLVDVALNDRDRFLTLVTTDGGDGHQSDRCFFGDPALSLESSR